MRLFKTPFWIKYLYPNRIWSIPNEKKQVFITFDDGPIEHLTPWVLDTLDKFGAKATFFCVGENVAKNMSIYLDIIRRGHSVGNHTTHHLNGKKNTDEEYLADFTACNDLVRSKLFRPPYGRMTYKQSKHINKTHKIVMWNVLSYDFDSLVNPEECLEKCIKGTSAGSIIVFHDNIKAANNLKYVLPKYLEWLNSKGYQTMPIQLDQRHS